MSGPTTHYRMDVRGSEPFCPVDKQDWPCDAAVLRSAIEASMNDLGLGTPERAERARQRLLAALDGVLVLPLEKS